MTRLMEPDIGEVLDRMSILQLKLQVGMRSSVPTAGWEEEMRSLDNYLARKIQDAQRNITSFSNDAFSKANAQLNIANSGLWAAEDEIRMYRKKRELTPDEKSVVCEIALHIVELNDERARLVREINRLFGVMTQEKLYV